MPIHQKSYCVPPLLNKRMTDIANIMPHGNARSNLLSQMQDVAIDFLSKSQRNGENETVVMGFLSRLPNDASKIAEAIIAASIPVSRRDELIRMRDIDENSKYLRKRMKNRNVSDRTSAFQIAFDAIFRRARVVCTKPFEQSVRQKLLSDFAKYLEMLHNASKNETMTNRYAFLMCLQDSSQITDVIFPARLSNAKLSKVTTHDAMISHSTIGIQQDSIDTHKKIANSLIMIVEEARTATCKDSNEETSFESMQRDCIRCVDTLFNSIFERALISSAHSDTSPIEIFWIEACLRQQLESKKLGLGSERGTSEFTMPAEMNSTEIVKRGIEKVSTVVEVLCTFCKDIDAAVESASSKSTAAETNAVVAGNDKRTSTTDSEDSSDELRAINEQIEELLQSDGGTWWQDDSKRATFTKLSNDRDRAIQKRIQEQEQKQESGAGKISEMDRVLQRRRDLEAMVARAATLVGFAGPYWCKIPAVIAYFDKAVAAVEKVIESHAKEDSVSLIHGRRGVMIFDPVQMLERLITTAKKQHKVKWYVPKELHDWRTIPRLRSYFDRRVKRIGSGERSGPHVLAQWFSIQHHTSFDQSDRTLQQRLLKSISTLLATCLSSPSSTVCDEVSVSPSSGSITKERMDKYPQWTLFPAQHKCVCSKSMFWPCPLDEFSEQGVFICAASEGRRHFPHNTREG